MAISRHQPYLDEPERRAEVLALLQESQREIDMLRRHPGCYGSVFFVMPST